MRLSGNYSRSGSAAAVATVGSVGSVAAGGEQPSPRPPERTGARPRTPVGCAGRSVAL